VICRIERGGNLAAADIEPAAEADDNRQQKGVAVDPTDESADGPYIVTEGPLRRRIPCETGFHGNEDADNDENCGDAGSSGLPCQRNDRELRRDRGRIAEIRDGAPLRLEGVSRWIRRDGFP